MRTSELIESGKLTTVVNVNGRYVVCNKKDFGAVTLPTIPEAIGLIGMGACIVTASVVTKAVQNVTNQVMDLFDNGKKDEDEN